MRAARLAERRGLLRGDLSRVQWFALDLLLALEDQSAMKSRVDLVKASLVGAGAEMGVMFPEFVPPSTDPSGVMSEFVSDEPTEDIRQLIENIGRTGTIGIEDFDFPDDEDPPEGCC